MQDSEPITFGEVFRTYRRLHEVSGEVMAKRIGISPSQLSAIETGKEIGMETVFKLMQWMSGGVA